MNITLVGYGKMGKLIEELINESDGFRVSAIACRNADDPLTLEALEGADVAIDFSHGSLIEHHISLYCQAKVPAVIGTTGWNTSDDTLIRMVEEAGIGVIVGSNFSAGMQSFIKVVKDAAQRLAGVGGYDVYIQEVHHAHKADSPSGTARTIAEALIGSFPNKTEIIYGQVEGRIAPESLQVVSVRGGVNAGLHQVTFDGPSDSMTLTHASHGRRGFAEGALSATADAVKRRGWTRYEDLF